MVVLNRIYTRSGDEGTTMLGNGERRKKYDLRVSAYGTVDEVTAAIGVARLHTTETPVIDAMLARIQNDLFDLAADLCSPDKGKGPRGERIIVELSDSGQDVSPEVRSYINRLSDFLFVASRYVNDKGARDVLWVPGAN